VRMEVQTTETNKGNQTMTESNAAAVASTEATQKAQNAPKKTSAKEGCQPFEGSAP
jgi:hypothetical protein